MFCHISCRHMASLLCGSFHVSSNHSSFCHILCRHMASLLCGSFHAFSKHSCLNVVTFCAGIWLLSCVGPFMYLQSTNLVECLFTFSAGIWILCHVGPLMDLQSTSLCNASSHVSSSHFINCNVLSHTWKMWGNSSECISSFLFIHQCWISATFSLRMLWSWPWSYRF